MNILPFAVLMVYNHNIFTYTNLTALSFIPYNYDLCTHPLETNKLFPADCSISSACGESHWKLFTDTWYQEEWGLCYGYNAKLYLPTVYSLLSIDVDTVEANYNHTQYRLLPGSKILLSNIFVITDGVNYGYVFKDCLTYYDSNEYTHSLVDNLSYNQNHTVTQYYYDTGYCDTRLHFFDINALLWHLDIYFFASDIVYDHESYLAMAFSKFTQCDLKFKSSTYFKGYFCYYGGFIRSISNFKLFRLIPFHTEYLNPLYKLFIRLFDQLLLFLEPLLRKIVDILLTIFYEIFLVILSSLQRFLSSYHIKFIESLIFICVYYIYDPKFWRSILVALFVNLILLLLNYGFK